MQSLLARKKITHKELSNKLGYTDNWFSNLILRERELKLVKIQAIANALGIDTDDFINKCCKHNKPAKTEFAETVEYGIANDVYTLICVSL